MNTTEMLAQLRLNCLLEDAAIDYPDSVLLRELSDSFIAKYQSIVVSMRNGFWEQQYYQPLSTGVARYRLTPNASVISKIEIGSGSSANYDDIDFSRMPMLQEGHSDLFETSFNSLGQPRGYVLRGNDIVVIQTPDSGGYVMRITYLRRPARFYASQNAQAGTDRGRVTAVNTTTRAITVNAIPFDMSLVTPAQIVNGAQVEVIKPSGWFEPSYGIASTASISGLVITITGTQPMRDIAAGDYLRVSGQTDWPMIPEDFHRSVVDTATVKILVQRGYQQKASNFAGDVTSDLQRFEELYQKRVIEEPRVIRAPLATLRRGSVRR